MTSKSEVMQSHIASSRAAQFQSSESTLPSSQQDLIRASWVRCQQAGLMPDSSSDLSYVDRSTLKEERQRLDLVRRIARPELELLYGQIAGSQFLVGLGTASGMIMDAQADKDFLSVARERNIRLGSLWRESLQGTNALGTCAVVKQPVLVHGHEHYMNCYKTLTCAAAPIFDSEGNVIAILDASSDSCPRPPHTLAMVNMSAKTIEMGYFREQFQHQHLMLSFHSRREYRHTVSTGLLALSTDGQVVAANRQAHFFLEGLAIDSSTHFTNLFATPFSQMIDKLQSDGEAMVVDHVGSRYFVSIENPNMLHKLYCVECGRHSLDPIEHLAPQKSAVKKTEFIANDPSIIKRLKYLKNAVKRSVPILITGATGTGKEVFAKYIHEASARSGEFVPVNCGAIPENLVEAELFGYVDGAYTGARKGGSDGLFHRAQKGTLFLDELGELPLATQVKLLRALDTRRYRPVGSNQDLPVDIQVVAATNANLQDSVQNGTFRSDLFYRLSTISIQLPRIVERADFGDLARYILGKIDASVVLTNGGLDALRQHSWPGNIRELRNFLTRLVVLNEEENITREVVAHTFAVEDEICLPLAAQSAITVPSVKPMGEVLEDGSGNTGDMRQRLLADKIQQACERHLFNVSKVAREVGVSRSTVYKYLKQTTAA